MIGKTLAHYEITGLLGKGGMGEVYRARDVKLGREVALKLLPEELSRDPERLARFEREAKVLASLNHNNIASIYGLDEAEGRIFLSMELAEGEDLSKRLERGALPVDEALDLAQKIAAGLEAAHAKGIVHRDLKPANVMISEDGQVKLLDFGLARAFQDDAASGDPMSSPTLTAAMTQHGMILGTAAYMSPEQARGKAVNQQTDIWSFGVLLFEMLTAHRLFEGETIADSLAAILHRDPDWSLLPAATPRPVRRLLRRCLERHRADRLRDIGDALIELCDDADAVDSSTEPSAAEGRAPGPLKRAMPWIVALLAIAAAASTWLARKGGVNELPLRKLTIVPISNRDEQGAGTLSPDGRRVAYTFEGAVWVRDLDQTTPRRLATVSGFSSRLQMWSPDGRWIAFTRNDSIWRVSMEGTAPALVCEIPPEHRFIAGAWVPPDRLVLAQWRGGLLEVSTNGGTLHETMPAPDGLVDYHGLLPLPDGNTLLASAHMISDSARVDVVRNGEILKSIVLTNDSFGATCYSPSGHIVFARDRKGLWAAPFSLGKLEKTGEPFLIDPDGDYPSVALDGSLVYARNIVHRPGQLVRIDLSGTVTGSIGEPGKDLEHPLVSPSGDLLVYSAQAKGNQGLWMLDLASGESPRRITQFKDDLLGMSWSADSRQLLLSRAVFGNWASPENGLYVVDVNGGSAPTRVSDGRSGQLLPDGGGVLYWLLDVRNRDRLAWKSFEPEATPKPFVASMTQAHIPSLSPDGRLAAFESSDSGTHEIWIARFPSGEELLQLSEGGGYEPAWSKDGRFLYYRQDDALLRVTVTEGARTEYSPPEELFRGEAHRLALSAGFDTLPDNRGFVTVQELPLEDAALVYVQNWAAEFQRRP